MSTTRTAVAKDTEKNAPAVTPMPEQSVRPIEPLHIEPSDEALATLPLEQLEKLTGLARARLLHAEQASRYWESECYWRSFEFDRVLIAYERRKHGFTEDMITKPSKRGESHREE